MKDIFEINGEAELRIRNLHSNYFYSYAVTPPLIVGKRPYGG